MTALITSWDQTRQTSYEVAATGPTHTQSRIATTTAPNAEVTLNRSRTTQSNAGSDGALPETINSVPLPVDRIYPHVFDESIQSGQALIHFQSAISDLKEAIEAFGIPDMQEVTSRLTQIAVAMGKAHLLTEFNESLGGVVSYIRRATLLVSSADITRSSLNTLQQVLMSMNRNPMLDLDEATELVDRLASNGWNGEHELANKLIQTLIEDADVSTDELQTLLFQAVGLSEGREES